MSKVCTSGNKIHPQLGGVSHGTGHSQHGRGEKPSLHGAGKASCQRFPMDPVSISPDNLRPSFDQNKKTPTLGPQALGKVEARACLPKQYSPRLPKLHILNAISGDDLNHRVIELLSHEEHQKPPPTQKPCLAWYWDSLELTTGLRLPALCVKKKKKVPCCWLYEFCVTFVITALPSLLRALLSMVALVLLLWNAPPSIYKSGKQITKLVSLSLKRQLDQD